MCQLHLGPLDIWSAGLKLSTEKFEPLDCPAVCSMLEEKPNCTKVLNELMTILNAIYAIKFNMIESNGQSQISYTVSVV
jgi:hypothetical protein